MQLTLKRSTAGETEELTTAGKRTFPMRLVFKVEDTSQVLSWPLAERLILGRADEGNIPEIDLSQFDHRYGVSRAHARFTYDGHALFVEDLNSTNGTRINGFELTPDTPYRLRNGDELEFGRLRLSVRLMRVPG